MNRSPKLLATIAVSTTLLLLCAYAVRNRFAHGGASLEDELDAANRLGLPVSAAEIEKMVATPDDQNAAPKYLKVLDLIKTDADVRHGLVTIQGASFEDSKPRTIQAAIALMPKMAPALKETAEAAEYPHCVFRHSWADVHKGGLPEISRLKKLSQALTFDAWQKSEHGDWRGALAELGSAEKVGRHIGEEPALVAFIAQSFCEGYVQHFLTRVIQRHRDDAAFLTAAQALNAQLSPLPDPRRYFWGETVMGMSAIDSAQTLQEFEGKADAPVSKGSDDALLSPEGRRLMKTKLLHLYRTTYEKLPADPQKWEEVQRLGEEMGHRVQSDKSAENLATQVWYPVFGEALGEALGRMEMRRRQTDVTLRLLQDRLKAGKFPAALPDYGKSSTDPFSGKPFGYRVAGKGFVLYSVGADRADNGGLPRTTTRRKDYDEVVTIS